MKLSDITLPQNAEAVIASAEFQDKLVESAWDEATAVVAAGYERAPEDVNDVREGARFMIPMLLPEEVETGDGRKFKKGVTTVRDLPIPLLWQINTDAGHDGSVIVGRIDSIERVGDEPGVELDDDAIDDGYAGQPMSGWGNARGVFDTGPHGREAERLVRNKMLRGVSADLDMFEASVDAPVEAELAADEDDDEKLEKIEEKKSSTIKNDKITVTQARITAATLVAKPAFQEVTISLDEDTQFPEEIVPDGIYEEASDDAELLAAAMVAAGAPVIPPRSWFENPSLSGPTPLTVTDEGRVFGHIAAWNVSHIGLPGNTRPPRSRSNYQYFRTGIIRTDNGDVPVGQLTLAGGHAPLHASAADAVKHYDDTASAIADVTAGEDAFGIWVSGALRPDATPEQVRALRASAPSGDWRPINGRLEMVAVCQVNVPGFPVARACVASGAITALVAAGARPLAELRESATTRMEERLAQLEALEFKRQRAGADARLQAFVASAAREKLDKFVD